MMGVLNVYKEKGFTSHDVVAIIRRVIGVKKVGHTGTLDPDATGVLPICIGSATKFAEYIASADKTYVAEVILGIETNTGDISGKILAQKAVDFHQNTIADTVMSFSFKKRGEYMQTPPMFSAIKIGGKKLYELARKGEEIHRPARPVLIHAIDVLEFDAKKNAFTIRVKCSKGTYIRSLAMDIGQQLGCGATMGKLERIQSGMFAIDTAITLDKIKEATQNGKLHDFIISMDALLPYPKIQVFGNELKLAMNGNPLPYDSVILDVSDKYWVCNNDTIIGLFSRNANKLCPEVML